MNLKIAEIYEHKIITGLSQTTRSQVVTTDHPDEPEKMLPKFAEIFVFQGAYSSKILLTWGMMWLHTLPKLHQSVFRKSDVCYKESKRVIEFS